MHSRYVKPPKIAQYTFKNYVGRGNFADVYEVITGFKPDSLCCKVISKQKVTNKSELKHLYQEISNLSKCKHPNILRIVDFIHDSNNYYIITEYCSKGTLCGYITSHGKLDEEVAKMFFYQIMSALAYLHKIDVAHRDIKSDNIFIDKDNNVKIGDLGLSSDQTGDALKTECGTHSYCAPEILMHNEYDGKKADIWSSSILLYTMITARLPWPTNNKQKVTQSVIKGLTGQPVEMSDTCWDLVTLMANLDASSRPTCEEILQHSWFQNVIIPTPVTQEFPSISESNINHAKMVLLDENDTYMKQEDSEKGLLRTSTLELLQICDRIPKRIDNKCKCN